MAKNAPLGLAGLLLVAASIVLLLFVILGGVTDTAPLDRTYFLRADTSGITGARSVSQWNYFYICAEDNVNCSRARPAPAFGVAWDSNPENAPEELVGGEGGDTTSYKFYYLWRFGWVFFIITLFFEVVAFFAGFLACCGRLGAAISGFVSFIALFFNTLAVVLMTVTFIEARDAFRADDRDASIGRYAFGFAWGGYAALLIASVLFCVGIRKGDSAPSSGRRGWRRRRSTRSYEGRRVKEDYA